MSISNTAWPVQAKMNPFHESKTYLHFCLHLVKSHAHHTSTQLGKLKTTQSNKTKITQTPEKQTNKQTEKKSTTI